MIPVYKPYLPKESLKYAHDAIDSTWVSSHGKYLEHVKEPLKESCGSKYIILTNNGTSATHLLAIALKYKYPNVKNVIVPTNVYVAAWNMFLANPKYNLIPFDADEDTWNLDISKLDEIYEARKNDTAFLAVHNIGNIINIPELKKRFPEWVFLEDNCEGFLGHYNDRPSGSESFASSVSFFGNKTITSGEGGMFCTNDKETFEYINRAKSHFITRDKFVFDGLGYNYRMTNVQAALLMGQLEILQEIRKKKLVLFDRYKHQLSGIDRIKFQKKEPKTFHSHWMFGIKIEDATKDEVDRLKLYLFQNDIDSRPMFPPIWKHPHLSYYGKVTETPIAQKLYDSVIILPSYPDLSSSSISYICNTIKDFFK